MNKKLKKVSRQGKRQFKKRLSSLGKSLRSKRWKSTMSECVKNWKRNTTRSRKTLKLFLTSWKNSSWTISRKLKRKCLREN
jgi:hypothetical protein